MEAVSAQQAPDDAERHLGLLRVVGSEHDGERAEPGDRHLAGRHSVQNKKLAVRGGQAAPPTASPRRCGSLYCLQRAQAER